MKTKISIAAIFSVILISCKEKTETAALTAVDTPIKGTWKLLTGTLIENGDTTITDYTKDLSFIKIINDSHFAFLQHNIAGKQDPSFSAGGGRYSLKGDQYTEHLEYCSAREWENHDFAFTMTISGDTLIQSGIEKIEKEGINRVNTEKYVRVK